MRSSSIAFRVSMISRSLRHERPPAARKMMSSIEMIPTSWPASSTTGNRVTSCVAIVLKASRASSSGRQLKHPGGETSRASTSDALIFLVPSAIQISRSVIMPITLPEPSRIGSAPHRWFHILSANFARLSSGRHEITFSVISCFTSIGISLLYKGVQHCFHFRNAGAIEVTEKTRRELTMSCAKIRRPSARRTIEAYR